MPKPIVQSPTSVAQASESPTQRLDRLLHTAVAPLTGGLSPVSIALAMSDWAWHLTMSPGQQMRLAARAMRLANDTLHGRDEVHAGSGTSDDDPRFRHEAWATWPFNRMRSGFRNAETFWKEASSVPGMTAHHAAQTEFFTRQWLGAMAPANWLFTNPVVLQDAIATQGAHLREGLQHWLADTMHLPDPAAAPVKRFVPGRDVAVTPGDVVYRNRLVELIRYTPQTPKVHPEPVFIVPSWIMKYYILDLSPHNSMVRHLVSQGHTVFMLSWHNPDAQDAQLTMDDYLHRGIFDALQAIGAINRKTTPVHAMGYCLGGTLLSIAAATLARDGGSETGHGLPPLKTLTLLAAQTDFSEPGELGLFIDESQIGLLDNMTRGQGFLSGKQMAGSFQFLHSRDLVWTRQMREYLMGEREQPSDLMAWNADATRMPARMHHEYLTSLYLHNALATSSYRVDGHTVSLGDIHQPVFLVGTQRDHISPWRSVYKLHHLCHSEITFVLTSGGHNAGIISEPGHPNRSYQISTRSAHSRWIEPDKWIANTPHSEGSWWPAWHQWLADRSSPQRTARDLPGPASLGKAPGAYVLERYSD